MSQLRYRTVVKYSLQKSTPNVVNVKYVSESIVVLFFDYFSVSQGLRSLTTTPTLSKPDTQCNTGKLEMGMEEGRQLNK